MHTSTTSIRRGMLPAEGETKMYPAPLIVDETVIEGELRHPEESTVSTRR